MILIRKRPRTGMEEYTTTIIQTFMKGNIVSLVPH